ncbi:MAG TPA: hypothetical protein EYP35_07870 [Desulfobacterales bacterium]|nr:hypothetical protein [Desulfobacterales bacterium]HIP39856.1 hypothetical protein [Desulfocapsa sulfexigens]
MAECDFDKLITQHETDGLEEEMQKHLGRCQSCNHRYKEYLKLTGALLQARCAADEKSLPGEELPDSLKVLAAARKKQWLSGKVGKVLDFQGVTDAKEKQRQLKRILDTDIEDLPLAAFPDDLEDE